MMLRIISAGTACVILPEGLRVSPHRCGVAVSGSVGRLAASIGNAVHDRDQEQAHGQEFEPPRNITAHPPAPIVSIEFSAETESCRCAFVLIIVHVERLGR